MQRFEAKLANLAIDEAGTITGLAAVYETADRGGDIIHKGAFAGARAPLPMLASHDPADVVGVWDEIKETATGLAVKGRLLVADVARAAEVRALVLAGAMRGLSIGYVATKKAARRGGGRDLLAVELMEVSIVAVPMHPDAKITDVKAHEGGKVTEMDKETIEAKVAEIEAKAAGVLADAEKKAGEMMAPFVARLDALETKANRPNVEDGAVVTVERKAFRSYLSHGPQRPFGAEEAKSLTLSNNAEGGYLAPPELQAEILRDLVIYNPMRALIDVRGVSVNSIIYNKRVGRTAAAWHAEGAQKTESDISFAQKTMVVHEQSTIVRISNTLMADAPQAEAEVRMAIGEDFGVSEGLAFLQGTGAANHQPEGLMENTDIALFANGHAANLSPDALIKMLYTLPAQHRGAGTWLCNSKTLGILRTLKDGDGRFLWQPSFTLGQPETILGRPVVEMPDMPDIGANAFPIIYGDMKGYRAIDRAGLSILVDPYSLAGTGQTRIIATRRLGGAVLDHSRFIKLKMATAI